jgi:AbiV family abortive infection protein
MQKNKTLYNISRQECLIIYKSIRANADDQWSTAKILSENGKYGQARSHLIISMEEMIKCAIVILDGNGFDFIRTKGLNRYFSEHSIRAYTGLLLMICSLFGSDFLNTIERLKSDQRFGKWIVERMKDETWREHYLVRYLKGKLSQIRKELEFFSDLEHQRQMGFYCDYDDSFHTPILISHEQYDAAFRRIEKVNIVVDGIIAACEQDDPQVLQMKELYLSIFKNDGLYEKLGTLFSENRTSKLFEKIGELLADFKFAPLTFNNPKC